MPPASERSFYIRHGREIQAEYDDSAQGELELYKEYFRAAGRLVAVKMHGFHGRREPGPEGFLHTKGGLMYYHTDRLGSPVAITDRHGEPVVRYAWDAYGRAMAGVFEPDNSVGFTGKMRDEATGLTYFGARWYDTASGKFMSRDPIRDGWNWHAYVGGDPVNYVDPWGLMKSEGDKRRSFDLLNLEGTSSKEAPTEFELKAGTHALMAMGTLAAAGSLASSSAVTATLSSGGTFLGAAAKGTAAGAPLAALSLVAGYAGHDLLEGGGLDRTNRLAEQLGAVVDYLLKKEKE